MLIFTRNIGQSFMIGDDTKITLLGVDRNQVRVGIIAPKETAVHREEIYYRIQNEKSNDPITEQKISTLLTDDFAVTAHFDYQPEEPESPTYPGCMASVELNSVCLGTHDLMPVLSESVLSELADKCLESMNAKQRDN